jgi:hypothetical protein
MNSHEGCNKNQSTRIKETRSILILDKQRSDLFNWFLNKFENVESLKFKEMTIVLFNRISNLPLLNKENEKIFVISLARTAYKLHGKLSNDSMALNVFIDILRQETNAFISSFDVNQLEIYLMNSLNWDIKLNTLSSCVDEIMKKSRFNNVVLYKWSNEVNEISNCLIKSILRNLVVENENIFFLSSCVVIILIELITGIEFSPQSEYYQDIFKEDQDSNSLKETSNFIMKITEFEEKDISMSLSSNYDFLIKKTSDYDHNSFENEDKASDYVNINEKFVHSETEFPVQKSVLISKKFKNLNE